ncbi:MAG: hypothetical protein DPW13_14065 [Planctomycetes bacterium]|nr:hypothetical protein [Planctomycetota bacterium]
MIELLTCRGFTLVELLTCRGFTLIELLIAIAETACPAHARVLGAR